MYRPSRYRKLAPLPDLTAMVDVVMLILIFFIMSAQFQDPSEKNIDLPSSTEQNLHTDLLPLIIKVEESGMVYLYPQTEFLPANHSRSGGRQILANVKTPANAPGIHIEELAGLEKRAREGRPLPADLDWSTWQYFLDYHLKSGSNRRVGVKADRDTPYPYMKKLFDIFQDHGINRFDLFTQLESSPGT